MMEPRGPHRSRREFLRLAGAGILLASSAPLAGGCARLLEWSATEEESEARQMRPLGETSSRTTGSTSTETSTAPSSPVTTGTTSSTVPAWPDLAVARGADPAQNVRQALDALGGIERFVTRGANVVVKPNVLTGRAPEYAATTNPAVVAAVVGLCFEAGAAAVTVLDRPTSAARTAFEVSGIGPAAESAGARVKYLSDRNYENIALPQGRLLDSWPLVTDVFEADVFINIPIAKTHSLAGLTMAMKNLMGIMGGSRGAIHIDFSQKIVDVCSLVRPHLAILDAHRMLIRNGPTGGSLNDVLQADTLVAGTNQVTVDAYGATLFNMMPVDLTYLRKANEQELGEIDLSKVRIVEAA